ncbi:MAG: DUF4388 domain-containing protein [Acidobacteriota bacterium]
MKGRVVMVDDEEHLVWTISRQFVRESPDIEFEGFVDPVEALARIRQSPPNLLVTDVRMPRMNGLELALKAREVVANLPIIIITAYNTPEVRQEVMRRGAIEYLEKPFDFEVFLAAINRALAKHQGFSGSISLPMLPDLVQIYALANATGALEITRGSESGMIWFERGNVVHAECQNRCGEEAFYNLLTWEGGQFKMNAGEVSTERSITLGWQELLMEGCRLLDEKLEEDWESENEDEPAANHPNSGVNQETVSTACKEILTRVDGSVICGIVNLETGQLMGIHNTLPFTENLNQLFAVAAVDLFRGTRISQIEQMTRAHRGVKEDGKHYFEEIHIISKHHFHFAKTICNGRAVIILVTKKTTYIGRGWAQLKSVLPLLEPLII